MKIRYLIWLILFFGVNITLKSQENKFSIQTGCFYPGFQYKNAQLGFYGGFDFTHVLKNELTLSSHFTVGKSRYYEEELTNVPTQWQEISDTNAEIYFYTIGLLLGKEYSLSDKLNFWLQGGFGLSLRDKQDIPLALYDTQPNNPTYQYSFNEIGYTIPIQISLNYRLSDKVEVGLLSGCYLPKPIIPRIGIQTSILF